MDRWVFIHIMKTAGTSFRRMLEDTPDLPIFPTQQELSEHPKGWYLPASELVGRVERGEVDLSSRRILCGHYAAGIVDRLPGVWRGMTILRDPVRRSLSIIAHRHGKAGVMNRFLKPNVAKYLDDEGFVGRQILDYQTKVFALDGLGNVNAPHPIDEAAFARAKDRLMAMDFVGLTEDYARSIAILEKMSGLTFPPIKHENKSRGYEASEADVKRIKALVPFDLELYELAREKLHAQARIAV